MDDIVAEIRENLLGNIIDRFYEAAGQPELWSAVLEEMLPVMGAEGALIMPGPKASSPPVWTSSLNEMRQFGINEGWYENNARVARGVAAVRHAHDVITESMIFSQQELEHIPYNAEFINRFGLRSFAGFYLVPDGHASIIISIERRRNQGDFTGTEIEHIRSIIPHLQRAGQMARHIGTAYANGMLDAFEQIRCGGIQIDFFGRCVGLNAQAERHLGRGITIFRGQVLASSRTANDALQRLIGSVVRPGPAHEASPLGPVALPRPAGRPLIVHAAPLVGSARALFQKVKAILLIVDPEEHLAPSTLLLQQAFGLTLAEARLATKVGQGRDIRDIAAESGVSEGTLRSQLKSVFAKTDTHRQAELAALIGRLSLPVLDGS